MNIFHRNFHCSVFQSTPSTRRETIVMYIKLLPEIDFNPLPPHGGRQFKAFCWWIVPVFQSTPSTRRETHDPDYNSVSYEYFNPLPPHGGRLNFSMRKKPFRDFNPLPPHGGRRKKSNNGNLYLVISIHSLHTEGDHHLFAFRRSARNFNPLPPHGGRLGVVFSVAIDAVISIHSLHTEGDVGNGRALHTLDISIHSLHTEGDRRCIFCRHRRCYFNPLPPHGGRQQGML